MKFRDLTAGDIDVRVQSVKANGLVALLYKDARVDQNILDATVGPERWQREHYEVKGNLFCRVGIRCENEWVWKSDCGTESNTEKEKGEASDSFKRACFNWGIGRELYTSPFIWIPAEKCNIKDGKCYDKFSVERITIVDKVITGLAIRNDTKGCTAYTFGEKTKPQPPEALNYVIPYGAHEGETLGSVYKTDRKHIELLYNAAKGKADGATVAAIDAVEAFIKASK